MSTSINTLKNWFRTGLKPTQAQFWAWLDSYRHKDEAVPVQYVSGLQELLDTKVDKKELVQPDQVGPYDPLKSYVYDAAVAEYVSYANPQSANPQYQVEGFYRLRENAPAGENPETHPAHWVYQGTVLGDIAIEDVVGLREELDWLSENAGGGHDIQNEAGETLPEQPALQIKGAPVLNDTENGRTIIDLTGKANKSDLKRQERFSLIGHTVIPTAFDTNTTIVAVPKSTNLSGVKLVNLADASEVPIIVGAAIQPLPIAVPAGDYEYRITYQAGKEAGVLLINYN